MPMFSYKLKRATRFLEIFQIFCRKFQQIPPRKRLSPIGAFRNNVIWSQYSPFSDNITSLFKTALKLNFAHGENFGNCFHHIFSKHGLCRESTWSATSSFEFRQKNLEKFSKKDCQAKPEFIAAFHHFVHVKGCTSKNLIKPYKSAKSSRWSYNPAHSTHKAYTELTYTEPYKWIVISTFEANAFASYLPLVN